jgi:diguanylate cyclase (GGDEF)-like protein/PAS domain S-box-containing protein
MNLYIKPKIILGHALLLCVIQWLFISYTAAAEVFTHNKIYNQTTLATKYKNLQFSQINIESGLSDNFVRQVYQDSTGFIWFATSHGLNKYDGVRYKAYHFDVNDDFSVLDNEIEVIYQERLNQDSTTNYPPLWIGTYNGLSRYQPETDNFIGYSHDKNNPNSLSNNQIVSIYQDSKERLWVGTACGINRKYVNQSKIEFKRYFTQLKQETACHNKPGDSRFLNEVYGFMEHNEQLLALTTQGIYQYLLEQDRFESFDATTIGLPIANAQVKTSYLDNSQQLWLAVSGHGVFYFDKNLQRFISLADRLLDTSHGEYLTEVISIHYDINQQLWLGTATKGLLIYHPQTQSLNHYGNTTREDQADDRVDFAVKVSRDLSGLMWLSTNNFGASYWNPNTLSFEKFADPKDTNLPSGINSFIWNFGEDVYGDIYAATEGGVFKFNPHTTAKTQLDLGEQYNSKVYYFLSGFDDSLWITSTDLVIKYHPTKGIIQQLTTDTSEPLHLPKDKVVYAALQVEDHLYAAINNHGLRVFDLKNKTFKDVPLTYKGITTNAPLTIHKALDGSLWILTQKGLFNYSHDQQAIRFAIGEGVEQLSYQHISSIYQESLNKIWVGTSGGGLNLVTISDYEKGQFEVEQLNYLPELRYQVINGVIRDDTAIGKLWISTHSGIYLFNPETKFLRQFNRADGLQSSEFNEGAYFKDSNGFLYFGGVSGFNRITPHTMRFNDFQPPMVITNIKAQCREAAVDTCQIPTTRTNDQHFHLPDDVNSLEIQFAILDFTNPQKNRYRTRLTSTYTKKGDWQNLGNEARILLTGLDSGNYTLEIQGANNIENWDSNSISKTRFHFIIDAPWYLQGYSVFSAALIIAFAIYLKRINRQIKAREQKRIDEAIRRSEENFKSAMWGSGDEMWEWYIPEDKLLRTNPMRQLDDDPSHFRDSMQDLLNIVHPEDISDVKKALDTHLSGASTHFESYFRLKSKGGGYLWALARARVVQRDEQKKALRLLGTIKDITLIKTTEDKLKLIAKAFDNTKDGISILDPTFRSALNNEAFYKITGTSIAETMHKQYFFSEGSLNHDMFQQIKISLKNFGEWEGEIWEKRPNGERFALELKIDSVLDDSGQLSHYICVFSDITYRKLAEEELRKLANFDSLTQLPNRSLFMDRLHHAMEVAKRNKTKFALMFLDLDHFKNINDSMGHSAGDELLKKVATRLTRCVRNVDTVSRLGGDEFTLLLENINSAEEVGKLAEKIIKRMQKSFEISGNVIKITPSIGIGLYPEDGEDIATLMKNSDLAMYSAKEEGRNNYQFFTNEMTSSAITRINLENKLREAIEQHQFELYYQPKVYAVNGELTGFEALIRWFHPEDGMISPAEFIPIAEETGLILPIGDWILEQAISQAKAWSKLTDKTISVAINLSAKQFQQENLKEQIANLLNRYQLDASYIELEITESTLMLDSDKATQTIENLKALGIKLSLDDFGTGYSSLSYLKRFPVNKLKVDQSFVRDITTDPGDASIVASIISLAHNLGLTVVAEGCETTEQLDFIRSYHCQEVQGYLFSRPLPTAAAEEVLVAGRCEISQD